MSLSLRNRKKNEEFTELDEDFQKKIRDTWWLMYFFADGKPVSVKATFSGIDANLAERALAKVGLQLYYVFSVSSWFYYVWLFEVGDSFIVKFENGRFQGKIKAMGMKTYIQKCLEQLSQACKDQSGEPDVEFAISTPQQSVEANKELQDNVIFPPSGIDKQAYLIEDVLQNQSDPEYLPSDNDTDDVENVSVLVCTWKFSFWRINCRALIGVSTNE